MFEDVLIESGSQKGRGRKLVSLPVALGLHLVVIGVVVGASIWFVEDVQEPPIPVTFYAAAPPPPPPPPAAAPKLVNKVEPPYPEAARKARMEGVVILEFIITTRRTAEDVKFFYSMHPH